MKIRNIPRGWLYTAIRLLCLSALIFASMLAVDYYFTANTFCAEGKSCDIVAHSEFGQKYGIFLPTLGLVAYSFFFLTSFFFAKTNRKLFGKSLSTFWIPLAIICCAIGAILFILVQAIEIDAFCWLCMGIDTSAIVMVIPAVLLMINDTKPEKSTYFSPLAWISLFLLAALGPMSWGAFPHQFDNPKNNNLPEYIQSFYAPNKINVVEISSFDCPHCQDLHPHLSALIDEYGSRVNFTRLTLPLTPRKEACVAYLCAEQQKKSEQYADCLFKDPSKDPNKLLEYARECSIDESSFKACLTNPATSQAVDKMIEDIKKTGFQGFPTVWINDTQIIGFDSSKGIQPYRDAMEAKTSQSSPMAFLTVIILALICLILGFIFDTTPKKKKREEDETEA